MLVLLLLAFFVTDPAQLEQASLVGSYLDHMQDTACEKYPTAPCCGVSKLDIARYSAAIVASAIRHGVDPLVIAAIIWHESKLLADAVGPNGRDAGLMQISPKWVPESKEELLDPIVNIEVGARVLAWWASRPKYQADYVAHYGAGIYLGFRHLTFQAWVHKQAANWRKYAQIVTTPLTACAGG